MTLLDAADLAGEIGLDAGEIAERLRFLEFAERDAAVLAELHRRAVFAGGDLIHPFYAHLFAFAPVGAKIGSDADLARLKQAQDGYFRSLLTGPLDDDYVLGRLRVGVAHHRIGLEPKWYIGAYRKYLSLLIRQLAAASGGDAAGMEAAVQSLLKVVLFDMGIAIEVYFHAEHAQLRESELRFRALVEQASESFFVHEPGGRILDVNRHACESLGYGRDQLLRMSMAELAQDAAPYPAIEALEESSVTRFGRMRRQGGGSFAIEERVGCLQVEGRTLLLSLVRDVTERRRAGAALRLRERALAACINGVMLAQPAGDGSLAVIYVNPAFERMTGYESAETAGRDPLFLLGDDTEQLNLAQLRAALESGGEAQVTLRNYRKDGSLFWNEMSVAPVPDEDGRPSNFVILCNDVTETVRRQDELERQAHYDSLTGLSNRLLLQDRMQHAISQARRSGSLVATMFLDLDDFKAVNDSLGHEVGDRLLRMAADRLRATVRGSDTVARLGGDEFIIMLSDIADASEVAVVAAKVLDVLNQPFAVAARPVQISASIGISIFPQDAADAATAMRHADTAMYAAKALGRSNYRFFDEAMNHRILEHMQIVAELRLAVARRQLHLHFQPKVNILTQEVDGAEALLRWQHPRLGNVPPDRFIPAAEESGLIDQLGDWVLREACRQMRAWSDRGLPPVKVAINLSANQFLEEDLPERLAAALGRYQLPPDRLEVELTESVLMRDPQRAVVTLTRIRNLGIRVAVDDFGTGYSSLAYLKRLPLNAMKIDRFFISQCDSAQEDAAIVQTIIALGRTLNLETIAEGVEAETQLAFLRAAGCTTAQGYLFTRPLSSSEFRDWLENWRPSRH
jgi:diguanylate cyclase (GGDEF)-like protein/PAS domain S-box-containing protein